METPDARRVNYVHAVEAVLKHAAKGRLTPEMMDKLATLGVDVRRTLYPEYDLKVWIPCLQYIAQQLFPGMLPEEALRQLGRQFVQGYEQTIVGKATMAVARLIGTRRGLGRMQSTFRTGNNYLETRMTERGPGHVEIWANEQMELHPYLQGILEEGLRATGAADPRVNLIGRKPEEVTLDVQWAEKNAEA